MNNLRGFDADQDDLERSIKWQFVSHLQSYGKLLHALAQHSEQRRAAVELAASSEAMLSECLATCAKLPNTTATSFGAALDTLAQVHARTAADRRTLSNDWTTFSGAIHALRRLVSTAEAVHKSLTAQQALAVKTGAVLAERDKTWDATSPLVANSVSSNANSLSSSSSSSALSASSSSSTAATASSTSSPSNVSAGASSSSVGVVNSSSDASTSTALSPAHDAVKLATAQRAHYVARRQFASDAATVWAHLVFDVELEKDLLLLEHTCALLAAERQFCAAVFSMLADLRAWLDDVRACCNAQRDAFREQQRNDQQRERIAAAAVGTRSKPIEDLMRSLVQSDLLMAEALCASLSGPKLDQTLAAIILVADACGALEALLRAAVEREVGETTSAGTLFRGNTIATRLLTGFVRHVGADFLAALLASTIGALANTPAGFEVDDAKCPPGVDVNAHLAWLSEQCVALLDRICGADVPPRLAWVCALLRGAVERKFGTAPAALGAAASGDPARSPTASPSSSPPESPRSARDAIAASPAITAVGGLVCLRYISPAILIAEVGGDATHKRVMMFQSKMVQNTSNGTHFREQHLRTLNPLVEAQVPKLHGWFDALSNATGAAKLPEAPRAIDDAAHQAAVARLLALCREDIERVGKALLDRNQRMHCFQFVAHLGNCAADDAAAASELTVSSP